MNHLHYPYLRAMLPCGRLLVAGAALLGATTLSAQTYVTSLGSGGDSVSAGDWIISDQAGGASATLVDLAGASGDLSTNDPYGRGALRLTTGLANDDKVVVTTYVTLGDAATVLNNLEMGYSYFKATVDGGNIFAAPALRIRIQADGGTGDNVGELVYEPYWNQPGGGAPAAPADAWQTVSINSDLGAGNPNNKNLNGGWWWDGGFEINSSSGGPPLHSLSEWVTLFQASDATDFANAQLVSISLSIGSYNKGQDGYVDALTYAVDGGSSATYSFAASAVPEPSSYALFAGVIMLAVATRRRRPRAPSN